MAGSANITIKLDLTGERELMRKLDRLSDKAGRRALRKAMRAGARPIVKHAKQLAPVGKRTEEKGEGLKESIGTRFRWYGRTGTDVAVIGPRIKYKKERVGGKLRVVKDAQGKRVTEKFGQHGYIIEYGTKPRYTKKGAFRGLGPAMPFMRPAWDAEKGASERAAVRKLREEVEKEARRGG